jgi:sarcosine oxidase
MDADVLVLGVGTMGSAALWRLAGRGVRVLGLERFAPGNEWGSGHGDSRMLRTAYAEGFRYVPLVRAAVDLWRQLEREVGASLLTITGGLLVGVPEEPFVRSVAQSVATHGLPHEVLTPAEVSTRWPEHRLAPDEIAIVDPSAGLIRAEAAIGAATGRALDLGARLLTGTRVDAVEADAGGVRVRAGGRTFTAGHAIVSVGPWLKTLLPRLDLPLTVTRHIWAWFPARRPEAFTPERFPVFVRRERASTSWYGFPSVDGTTVKLSLDQPCPPMDPDAIPRDVEAEDVAEVSALVATWLRGLEPTPVRTATCIYTSTPDRHFVVGPAPGMPNVTLLSPCSGHGFKFAPLIGEIAADLATGTPPSWPLGDFAPERFTRQRLVSA